MHRTPGLDTLRAIAIVWVMLFHSFYVGGLGEGYGGLERSGWMGVDLFFVLSGYLIGSQVLASLQATGRLDVVSFYRRRGVRILPAFLVVFAIYALLPDWRETPGMQPLWQFPTFTFNLLFDTSDNYAFSHVWSLCVEEHFYLAFPFLAFALTRRPAVWKFVAGGNAGLAYLRHLYYPTWSRLDGLLAGVVLAACRVYRPAILTRLRAHTTRLLVTGLVLLAASLVMFDGARTAFWPCVIGYPLLSAAMAVFVIAASGGTWLARLQVPGAGWLAGASYSLYLSHKLVFALVERGLDGRWADDRYLRFGLFAAATLAGGALLHYAVERPFLRWRDRRVPASATLSPPKVIQGVSAAD